MGLTHPSIHNHWAPRPSLARSPAARSGGSVKFSLGAGGHDSPRFGLHRKGASGLNLLNLDSQAPPGWFVGWRGWAGGGGEARPAKSPRRCFGGFVSAEHDPSRQAMFFV